MDLLGICMGILDLTNKLIALKSKCKALDRIYFMSQVFQKHSHSYGKGKIRNENYEHLSIFLSTLPSQDGGGATTPHPPAFFTVIIFKKLFAWIHRYLDKGWVN